MALKLGCSITLTHIPKTHQHKPQTIPLTPQTFWLLEYIKSNSGHREFLFPNHRNPKSHANSQTANMALKRMGVNGQLVSHGLRALASTN